MSEFDSPEIYRKVLEELPAGVYLVDRHRRIVFWNAGAERICGYLRQDVVGRFLSEHLIATSGSIEVANGEDFDPLNQALRDGQSSTARVSILHKEGYRVPIVLQTVPIRNEHGNVIAVAECFADNIAASERPRRTTALSGLIRLDEVTGLPSKHLMEVHLQERIAVFAERLADFGILLIAVDDLEHLRTVRGPGVVTRILRLLSHTIENSLRPNDVVGAWTENRFLVVLADCQDTDLERVANRIQKMIGQSEVEWWGDRFAVTAALGGTGCGKDDTVESLVQRAARSLVESQAAGGNRVTVVK